MRRIKRILAELIRTKDLKTLLLSKLDVNKRIGPDKIHPKISKKFYQCVVRIA